MQMISLARCKALVATGLLVGVGLVSPAAAAITAGNHLSAQFGANGGTTAAMSTSGATLIVLVASELVSGTPCTPSDSQTNTYTGLTAQANASETRVRLWYVAAPSTSGTHTFTCAGTNHYPTVTVMAFNGVAASPFDQQNGAQSDNGALTTLATGSVTPTEDNELVVTGIAVGNSAFGGTPTVSGYTVAEFMNYQGGTAVGGALAYVIQTTATATDPTWVWTNGGRPAAAVATFKAAAAGGSTCTGGLTLLGAGKC